MADNLDPETLRQLNDSMREMRETVAGMVPAMVLMTAAMNENMNATLKVIPIVLKTVKK